MPSVPGGLHVIVTLSVLIFCVICMGRALTCHRCALADNMRCHGENVDNKLVQHDAYQNETHFV